MTKFDEAQILDLLPIHLTDDTHVQALSYSIRQEMDRLIILWDKVISMSDIDSLNHDLLDYLAIEWRTQYYDQEFDIDKKRALVKNTLNWHRHAGTPEVVQELVDIVFGGAEIVEWYNMGTEPGTFSVSLYDDIQVTPEIIAKFTAMIQKAKNTRSHLLSISLNREIEYDMYLGVDNIFCGIWNIEAEDITRNIDQELYYGLDNTYRSLWVIESAPVKEKYREVHTDSHMGIDNEYSIVWNI